MKLRDHTERGVRGARGFTLLEAVTASTILVMIITAVISFNLWGLAMATRSQIYLSASDDARNSLRQLHQDIRTGYNIIVGSGTSTGFTPALGTPSTSPVWGAMGLTPTATASQQATNLMVGNALWLCPSTNTNGWVYYYIATDPNLSTNGYTLFRTNYNGTGSYDYSIVSANPITNDGTNYLFTLQNYLGQTLTGSNYAATPYPLVNVYLSFTKLQNAQILIGATEPVEFYQISTTIGCRQRP
jgi:type II secretory pathway pseudopilin PulG